MGQHRHPASKLDMHGCPGVVCRSRDPMLVHTRGVIVKDTSTAWHVLSQADKMVVCPKGICDWKFSVSGQTMVLAIPGNKGLRRCHEGVALR